MIKGQIGEQNARLIGPETVDHPVTVLETKMSQKLKSDRYF
jgi:hypothetical protein